MLLAWGADAAVKDKVSLWLPAVAAAATARGTRPSAAAGVALPAGWQDRGGAGRQQHCRHQGAAGRSGTGGGEEGASVRGHVGVGCSD